MTRLLSDVPNHTAFTAEIWAPDLDAGFVPQGVGFSRGRLVLSAYRSTDPKQSSGPCRLFFIAPATGAVLSRIDLPASCGHAGGIAALPDGRIVVADTHALYTVTDGHVTATTLLAGKLRGSFAEADSHTIWIGSYNKSGGGTLWQYPLDVLGLPAIDENHSLATYPIPAQVQGLAFDRNGGSWLTVSGSRDGALLKYDLAHGRVVARDSMPGIEDIAVDQDGMIWAVSEAGSIRWSNWPANYPVLFAIDPTRLR